MLERFLGQGHAIFGHVIRWTADRLVTLGRDETGVLTEAS